MSPIALKPVDQQVVVLTGATSGIGLATARRFARAGAKLVLCARNEAALREVATTLGPKAQAEIVVADMSKEEDAEAVAKAAVARFGRIDTWVNNAGLAIYGRTHEVSLADQRQLFETNFWSVVNGSRVALRHLRGKGGAIINVGSVLSVGTIPLQGTYCASKHAVKSWTDALRIELLEENAPVQVTLIKPAAMNTPFVEHAKNYMAEEPVLPPPVYDPNLVAQAIVHAAAHPKREITVGGLGALTVIAAKLAPSLADFVMSRTMFAAQKRDLPKDENRKPSLYGASQDGKVHGPYPGPIRASSGWLTFRTLPTGAVLTLVAAGAALTIAAKLAGDGRLGVVDTRSKPRRWADRMIDDVQDRAPDASTFRSLGRRAERLYAALTDEAAVAKRTKKAARRGGLLDLFA